ncbi:MAG: YbaB/EbfC family nucleoid-associated protein [Patescibacteria group bacterium]|jgi:hypothetical protein
MFEKIKQLKNLRDQAQQIKSALEQEVVEGTAHAGSVRIRMNGNQEVLATEIDSTLIDLQKKDELQNAVADATNDAIRKVQQVMASKMRDMGGFPGM